MFELTPCREASKTKNNIVLYNIINERLEPTKYIKEFKVRFNSFVRPDYLESDALNIVVDNSFDFIKEKDNIVFIDHHLSEEINETGYNSNASMMLKFYKTIFSTLKLIFDNFKFDKIIIHMHHDIDGLASCLICIKILKDILDKKEMDKDYENNLKFLEILGNYGDIYQHSKIDLSNYFYEEKNIDIFDKKMKQFCKALSRFFKSTRTVYPCFENEIERETNLAYEEMDLLLKEYGANIDYVRCFIDDLYSEIYKFWHYDNYFDIKNILIFLNSIIQNKVLNLILDIYNKEIERFVDNFIDSDTPAFDMTIQFKNDPTNTKFKLLIIDSPFDCGRSVLWKYRSSLKYKVHSAKENKWKYSVTDWSKDKDLIHIADNIVCYNRMLKKLTLDGSNNAAHNIADILFNGGGHSDLDNGRSLGSVIIDNEAEFMDSFIVVDIF